MKCETLKYKALEKKNQELNSVFSAAKVEEENILFVFCYFSVEFSSYSFNFSNC